MSIAIVGPEKFAFQDLVCVELALALRDSGLASIEPEPAGGEDARLSWSSRGALDVVEVQVKGAKGFMTLAHLAEHLAHYPERQATGSLLERLLADPRRAALFVVSARVEDKLAELLCAPASPDPPKVRSVSPALGGELANELAALASNAGKRDSKLQKARLADIARLAATPLTELRRALSRIFVVDRETAGTVEVRLHARLRASRFDTLSLRGTVAALTDELALAKKEQRDALAAMISRLDSLAPAAVAPASYVERGDETALLERLEAAGTLLIAGAPRAGKSWTQRWLGGRLQAMGYEVRQGSHVDEAERFLTDAAGAERAYLLDDPLGSREPVDGATVRLADLRGLLERLPSNRRLVVAQSEPVLLQVRGVPNLPACAFGARSWTELAALSVPGAQTIWHRVAADQGLAQGIIEQISQLINEDDRLRTPGALAYLAQTYPELPSDPDKEQIVLQAHSDASDFARALAEKSQDLGAVLAAAAIATGIDQGATAADLAFIIDGGEDRPGLEPELGVISLGQGQRPLPCYAQEPTPTAGHLHAIELLQRRRVIEEREARTNFTHPYLRAGAQMLLRPDIPADRAGISARAERGVACLSPNVSLRAARNLRWIRPLMSGQGTDPAFEIAQKGMRSIFPATRDACFDFLLQHAAELPAELKERIPNWSERVIVSLRSIAVDRGVAYIAEPDFFGPDVELDEIRPYLDAMERDEPLGIDLPLAKTILAGLEADSESMTAKVAGRLLRADEAVVRAAATRLWCGSPREADGEILRRLAEDRSPAVTVALLKGLVEGWPHLAQPRRAALLEILFTQIESAGSASSLFSRLVLFNRTEHFGRDPPWEVFAKLMPNILRRLPLSVSLTNGRFNAALDDAIDAGVGVELVPTIEAWGERVLWRLQRRLVSEFELAIVDPLLSVAPPERRLPILRELLQVRDTGARVVVTAALASAWDALDVAEKDLLLAALDEPRADQRWVRAAVLTGDEPAPELVERICGQADALELASAELEQVLGEVLFAACVHMFVGWPQPLWWFATHHRAEKTWRPVVRWLAGRASHPLHPAAFYDTIAHDDAALAAAVDDVDEQGLQRIFEEMLDAKVATVGDWRSEAWQHLLARGLSAGLLDAWMNTIDALIEGILDDVRDIRHWLGKNAFADRLFEMVPNDIHALHRIYNLVELVRLMRQQADGEGEEVGNLMEDVVPSLLDRELRELETTPPRLHGTWGEIGHVLRELRADASTVERAEAARQAAVERYHAVGEGYEGEPEPIALEGWMRLTDEKPETP